MFVCVPIVVDQQSTGINNSILNDKKGNVNERMNKKWETKNDLTPNNDLMSHFLLTEANGNLINDTFCYCKDAAAAVVFTKFKVKV